MSLPTRSRLVSAKAALFRPRSKRMRPGLDDKILTPWNALMIAALARASQRLSGRLRVPADGVCSSPSSRWTAR